MSLEEKIEQLTKAINLLNENIGLLKVPINYHEKDELIPLSKWNEMYNWPTVTAFRNIIFHKDTNGANHFIVKIGRRIYIDSKRFFEWARNRKNES